MRAQNDAQRAAAESLRIAQGVYKAGGSNYITVLNAEQTLLAAKAGLVKAQASRLQDTAALFQALGGGWWNRADETVAAYPKPAEFGDKLPLSALGAVHERTQTPPADSNPEGQPHL